MLDTASVNAIAEQLQALISKGVQCSCGSLHDPESLTTEIYNKCTTFQSLLKQMLEIYAKALEKVQTIINRGDIDALVVEYEHNFLRSLIGIATTCDVEMTLTLLENELSVIFPAVYALWDSMECHQHYFASQDHLPFTKLFDDTKKIMTNLLIKSTVAVGMDLVMTPPVNYSMTLQLLIPTHVVSQACAPPFLVKKTEVGAVTDQTDFDDSFLIGATVEGRLFSKFSNKQTAINQQNRHRVEPATIVEFSEIGLNKLQFKSMVLSVEATSEAEIIGNTLPGEIHFVVVAVNVQFQNFSCSFQKMIKVPMAVAMSAVDKYKAVGSVIWDIIAQLEKSDCNGCHKDFTQLDSQLLAIPHHKFVRKYLSSLINLLVGISIQNEETSIKSGYAVVPLCSSQLNFLARKLSSCATVIGHVTQDSLLGDLATPTGVALIRFSETRKQSVSIHYCMTDRQGEVQPCATAQVDNYTSLDDILRDAHITSDCHIVALDNQGQLILRPKQEFDDWLRQATNSTPNSSSSDDTVLDAATNKLLNTNQHLHHLMAELLLSPDAAEQLYSLLKAISDSDDDNDRAMGSEYALMTRIQLREILQSHPQLLDLLKSVADECVVVSNE